MRIVEITWLDSQSESGWQKEEEAIRTASADDMVHTTIGYLLEETDFYILVAMNQRRNPDMVADTMCIPTQAILSVKPIRRR